eukprot:gene20496-23281_t
MFSSLRRSVSFRVGLNLQLVRALKGRAKSSTAMDAISYNRIRGDRAQLFMQTNLPSTSIADKSLKARKAKREDGSIYEGDRLNGIEHGQGTLKHPDGSVYMGDFVLGKKHGSGKCQYANGSSYFGSFALDVKEGKGEMRYKNGNIYRGPFSQDVPHGHGKLTLERLGGSYEGQFTYGEVHGAGMRLHRDGSMYVGCYEHGVPAGQGTRVLPDGSRYVGNFLEGYRKGYGEYHSTFGIVQTGNFYCELKDNGSLANFQGALRIVKEAPINPDANISLETANWEEIEARVDNFESDLRESIAKLLEASKRSVNYAPVQHSKRGSYEGEWQHSLRHGQRSLYSGHFLDGALVGHGTMVAKNGTIYVGHFEHKQRHGQGILRMPTKQYEGQFFNNRYHGQGKMTFATGAVYTGGFCNGLMHGRGELISAAMTI